MGMKAKTIKSELSKKFNKWIDSIDDDKVKAAVSNNTIITGGSIASMLLGEQVNDFDLYFKNKEAVAIVAKYYLNKFKEDHEGYENSSINVKSDGRIEIRLHGSRNILGKESNEDEDDIIERENEYDTLDEHKRSAADEKPKYRPIFISNNAISLTGKVQVILRFWGDADEIHKNFDFVHAMNWWDSSDNSLHLRPESLEALLAKELRYVGSLYPICSLFRMKKFVNRGWKCNAGQILKMAWQIQYLDLEDPEVLREQLVGVDTVYFLNVISQLKEKHKGDANFKIEQQYLFEIINRIF